MAEDVVGGGEVEVEIGQREAQEIGLARSCAVLVAHLDGDLPDRAGLDRGAVYARCTTRFR